MLPARNAILASQKSEICEAHLCHLNQNGYCPMDVHVSPHRASPMSALALVFLFSLAWMNKFAEYARSIAISFADDNRTKKYSIASWQRQKTGHITQSQPRSQRNFESRTCPYACCAPCQCWIIELQSLSSVQNLLWHREANEQGIPTRIGLHAMTKWKRWSRCSFLYRKYIFRYIYDWNLSHIWRCRITRSCEWLFFVFQNGMNDLSESHILVWWDCGRERISITTSSWR